MKKYPTLPPWRIPSFRDQFDYKLRSYEEVVKQQEEDPPKIEFTIVVEYHTWASGATADKDRKVILKRNRAFDTIPLVKYILRI